MASAAIPTIAGASSLMPCSFSGLDRRRPWIVFMSKATVPGISKGRAHLTLDEQAEQQGATRPGTLLCGPHLAKPKNIAPSRQQTAWGIMRRRTFSSSARSLCSLQPPRNTGASRRCTAVLLAVGNLRFDQVGKLPQRLLPAEAARLDRHRRRNTSLHDGQNRAAG